MTTAFPIVPRHGIQLCSRVQITQKGHETTILNGIAQHTKHEPFQLHQGRGVGSLAAMQGVMPPDNFIMPAPEFHCLHAQPKSEPQLRTLPLSCRLYLKEQTCRSWAITSSI
jgi:hypothetical protein